MVSIADDGRELYYASQPGSDPDIYVITRSCS